MGETQRGASGEPGRRPAGPTTTPSAPGSAVLTPPTGLPAVGMPTPSVPDQRRSPDPITHEPVHDQPPAPPAAGVRVCSCGHPEEMHEHFRAGDDCGACGPRTCGSFRDRDDDGGPLRRAFRRLRG